MEKNLHTEDKASIYEAAVSTFGIGHQLGKAVEEIGELLIELGKVLQGKGRCENLAEEIGDVAILMEQVKMYYGIAGLTEDIMDYKTKRLQARVVGRQMAEEQMG